MAITKEMITGVKGRGFLLNRGTECFSGRVVSIAGQFSHGQLRAIADCAEKYGSGRIIFTSRLSAEIQGIPYEKIEAAEAYMASRGLFFGGTGAKIRPITACKGTTCVFGNIDTQGIAAELHERFYIGMADVKLPHKFKIGVGGCPNSCMKPSLNDIGIEGCRESSFDRDKCRSCGRCPVAESCPSGAVTRDGNSTSIDTEKCTRCGVCIGKCPFGAVPKDAAALCRIFVGGTWGKKQRMGTLLSTLYRASDIPEVVEKVILWYKDNGYAKERLGATVDRLGIKALEDAIKGELLIERKEEILRAPVKERP